MIVENALHILLRRVPAEEVIYSWLEDWDAKYDPLLDKKGPLYRYPNMARFHAALQNEFYHYSVDEANYVFSYMEQPTVKLYGMGVFGLIFNAVEELLITDSREECLCKYQSLLQFRELTHPIDPLIFVAAFLAQHDIENGRNRQRFSWSPIVRTDNHRLHKMLNKGMAENHFHISGSSNAFLFSWICLMNHFSADRRQEFEEEAIDSDPLDTIHIGSSVLPESSYLLTYKAACIRYFLYQRLMDRWAVTEPGSEEDLRGLNDSWLTKRLSLSNADACDQVANEIEMYTASLRELCVSDNNEGFIPDYAMYGEPLPPLEEDDTQFGSRMATRNYERRLYRPFSGEQRFLYLLFRAIYQKDSRIEPYLDLAYAYLLIYCKLRGELMQVNHRVGFGNFSKYQDRKGLFTKKWDAYEKLRSRVAQQVVLANPQVVAFEGRFCPPKKAETLLKTISNLYELASVSSFGQATKEELELCTRIRENAEKKMHYVLHFPKCAQRISEDETVEFFQPRDFKIREDVWQRAQSVIEAFQINPDIMAKVSGIDACSNEIDCRPEVFACAFRRIRQHRMKEVDYTDGFALSVPRITYHAGEDFLDPIDGMRAVDEAITFCEMGSGDRLGHALALGIDCEDWYATKKNTVLLRKQALLDNLVWLFGMMHRYNIQNRAVEDEVQKWFKKLYTEIYTKNLCSSASFLYSISIMDYFSSLSLRGNDPMLYQINPDANEQSLQRLERKLQDASQMEPWKLRERAGVNYDPISNALYHYYHFHFDMKLKSDEVIEYHVPRCVIDVACDLQEKMRYVISERNIGIECNPSSNFLIGTFKDYLKHPIFRFNNKYLFPATDPRCQEKNPYILASINTDDLGIFDTSLENEYALVACALEVQNAYCKKECIVPPDHIYAWLDYIRQNGLTQSFIKGNS